MKKLIWVFLALLVVSIANASADDGTYGYAYWAPKIISNYLQKVEAHSPAGNLARCDHLYVKALNKSILDIRYALGYFDDSNGQEKKWNGIDFGLSPSLDIEVFHALRKALLTPCRGPSLRLCGFSQSGDPQSGKVVLRKYLNLQGQRILVNLTLTQASASPYFLQNKGALASRQHFLTQQSEENFFGGLEIADVVFYNGHSRNGGGPDFAPPVLDSHNRVNYKGYYQVKQSGILKTMAALKRNPNPEFLLGLFSCYSRKHFYNTFMRSNPHQHLVLSADTVDYFDSLKASIGYLEGVLRGVCGQELADTAKQEKKIKVGFQGYHIN
ncbi:MAG: hypothetical protein ACXVB1_09490 [Pseudobdellovibrionaceae bacterium]